MSLINKRRGQFLFAGILLVLALALFFLLPSQEPETPAPEEEPPKIENSSSQTNKTNSPSPKRRVIGEDQKPILNSENFAPQNTPSPEWAPALEDSIRRQGGDDLKDLKITPIESLVWVHEGKALNVETAKVSFKDPEGREISFKAMVDSQSGKVLQTWDQPVFDDFSHKKKSGVKLDPRYLGQ